MLKKKKIIIQIILILLLMLITTNIIPVSFSKYVFEYEIEAAEINLVQQEISNNN